MSEGDVSEVFDYRQSYCKKIEDYVDGDLSFYKRETIIFTMKGKDHWFWDLSPKEKEFYTVEGEETFLRHKHIISKALKKAQNTLKKAQNTFTSPL